MALRWWWGVAAMGTGAAIAAATGLRTARRRADRGIATPAGSRHPLDGISRSNPDVACLPGGEATPVAPAPDTRVRGGRSGVRRREGTARAASAAPAEGTSTRSRGKGANGRKRPASSA